MVQLNQMFHHLHLLPLLSLFLPHLLILSMQIDFLNLIKLTNTATTLNTCQLKITKIFEVFLYRFVFLFRQKMRIFIFFLIFQITKSDFKKLFFNNSL